MSFHRAQLIVMLRATMSTLLVLEHGEALGRGDDPELDLVRVAEDRLRDRVEHVDVEALDLAGDRVARAEQEGVGRDARDEAAALLDLLHVEPAGISRGAGSVAAGRRTAGSWRSATSVPAGAGGRGALRRWVTVSAAAASGRESPRSRRPTSTRRAREVAASAPGRRLRDARRGSPVLLQSQRDAPPGAAGRRRARPGRRAPRRAAASHRPASSSVAVVRPRADSCGAGAGVEAREGGVAACPASCRSPGDRVLPVAAVVERADLACARSA